MPMLKYSYFILICAMVAIDGALLVFSLRHRDNKAVKTFVIVIILEIIALSFYGASLVIMRPEIKFFVHEMKFLGVVYFSVAFYVMYMQFFDMQDMLRKKYVALLTVVPTASVILALTNNFHHLFREKLFVVENAYGFFIGVQSGLLFWPYIIYSYTIFIFVFVIIIIAYFKTPRLYRVRLGIMIIAAIATLIINFVSISGIFFEDFGDATLISYTFAAVIQFYGLVLYKPARMIRMARGQAINEIKDPLIVFDYNDVFLDANLAAYDLFDLKAGLTRESFLAEQLLLPDMEPNARDAAFERGDACYTAKMKSVYDAEGVFAASVISISDITELKHRERELEKMASFDYMTGIPNRHSYLRELKRLRDGDLPVSIVHFSVRGMRAINRMRGNEAGDVVIKRVAAVLNETRGEGFCARIGGDEFALVLRNTPKQDALAVVKEIEDGLPGIQIASGVAVKQSNLDNINIIDKQSMDNMFTNKLIENSDAAGRGG